MIPIEISEAHKQIVERLHADRQFLKTKRRGKLLSALFNNPDDKNLRIEAFRGFVSKTIGIATEINRLQDQLDRYFDGPGKHLSSRIQIRRGNGRDRRPTDLYKLMFVPNVATLSAVRKFWKEYADGRPVAIAYGEPMFLTNADRSVFLRVVEDFNEPADVRTAMVNAETRHRSPQSSSQMKLIKMILNEPIPIYAYTFINAGEMMCMLALTRWLASNGIHVTEEGYTREATLHSFLNHSSGPAGANAIVLGSPRGNGVLCEYQKLFIEREPAAPYELTKEGLVCRLSPNKELLKNEPKVGDIYTLVAYGIALRMPGVQSGTVTILASNAGRAVEELGRIFTSDAALNAHAKDFFADSNDLASSFQMLFRFEVGDQGRVVKFVTLEDYWPKRTTSVSKKSVRAKGFF